jgi:hypothetical protein
MKGKAMTDMLQEYCDSRNAAVRVDRESGVIHGVKLLGLESRNGRSYLPDALVSAIPLYEEAKVNVNHPKGNPASPRDYQDRIGVIRNVSMQTGEGLFGDFCFNPKHALAEQLIWDAEHAPENVGFSHNVEARVGRRGDRVTVEAITRVQSVDLVADPATTRGLFESATASDVLPPAEAATAEPAEEKLVEWKQNHPELLENLRAEQTAEIARLRREVERLTELDAKHEKQTVASRLLREFQLPGPDDADPRAKTIVGKRFYESLLSAADERAMRELVEERAALVRSLNAEGQPQSVEQHRACADRPADVKSFVEAIT